MQRTLTQAILFSGRHAMVPLIALVFLLGMAPLPAHASVTVFDGLLGPNPGGLFPEMMFFGGGEFCDMYGTCNSYSAGYALDQTPAKQRIDEDGAVNHATNPDSLNFGTTNGSYNWVVHGGSDTDQAANKSGGKTCSLIDPTSTATWTTSSFDSPEDDKSVRWGQVAPYTVWQKANANDIGNSYIERLTCRTNALPANTLVASPTSITLGNSSVLSFDIGENAVVQGTTCTATNFTLPTHQKRYKDNVPSSYDCDLEGNCTPRTWAGVAIPMSPVVMENDWSGTVTVSPTVTTTYTYSCTNGNGTTNATATVCVGSCAGPAADVTFSAAPTSIASGGSSNLTWTSTNATSCSSATFATGGATSGTVAVSPSTTTTYSISCTGPGGSSAVKYATVTVSAMPDLVSGAVSPTTAPANTPVTLSAVVTNSGTGATGATFTNTFQSATDASGTGATGIGNHTNAALASGGNSTATLSYTFTSAGTRYIRVCADSTGSITESSEGDASNCGAWTSVAVSAPSSPVTSCTVSPSSLATVPGSVTWSAFPSNLGSYTWTPPEGGAPGGTGATLVRTYTVANTYGMSVTAGGATVTCPNVAAGAVCGTATPTITAVPTRVVSGGTSVITFSAGGVDSTCTLSGPGVAQTLTPASCNVATTNVTTPAITNQSVYTLSCDNGERTAQVVVNIIPKIQEF